MLNMAFSGFVLFASRFCCGLTDQAQHQSSSCNILKSLLMNECSLLQWHFQASFYRLWLGCRPEQPGAGGITAASLAAGRTIQSTACAPKHARWMGAAARGCSHAAAGPSLTLDAGVSQLDSTPTARLDISPLTPGLGALGLHLPATVDAPLSNRDVRYANARLSLPLYTGGGLPPCSRRQRRPPGQPVCAPGRLRLQVAEAYFNVLRARHAASVASQYLQSLQSYQRDVNNFFRKAWWRVAMCWVPNWRWPMPSKSRFRPDRPKASASRPITACWA
jgi:hypothetical protein